MKRVAIHGVPRSGTSWLGSLFDSHPKVIYRHQPLFSYSHKGFLTSNSSKDEIRFFFEDIRNTDDPFVMQEEPKRKGIIPTFKKSDKPTHTIYKEARYHHIVENLLVKEEDIKIIGIIRNPLSVIYSWLQAPREFRTDLGWKIEEEWQFAPKKNQNCPEEFYGYEKWKEVAYLFQKLKKQYPDRFYLVCYKHLLNSTAVVVSDLFSFVGLSVPDQTETFIKESRAKNIDDAYSVYRTKQRDDKWKGNLPEKIIHYVFNDLDNTNLYKYVE